MDWLRLVRDHIAASLSITTDDLELDPFVRKGGLGRFYEVFGSEYEALLQSVIRLEKKAAEPPMKTYIQSPYGGDITPEEVAAKMPEGTRACYVRVDQNLIWWVRGDGSTGAVEIWSDDRA